MKADTRPDPPSAIHVLFSYWGSDPGITAQDSAVEVQAATTLDAFLNEMEIALGRDIRAETAGDGTRFVTVNGVYCAMPDGGSRMLEDGDNVRVLPFVAGG